MSDVTKLITAPAKEPITKAEAKLFLKVDHTDDDALIDSMIIAARVHAEKYTSRVFITQTWQFFLNNFPSNNNDIILPKPPLISVTSVKFTDEDNVQVTFSVDNYSISTNSIRGSIILNPDKEWPSDTLHTANPIEIEFVAGYGEETTDISELLRSAMLLSIADLYETRQDIITGSTVANLGAINRLLDFFTIEEVF